MSEVVQPPTQAELTAALEAFADRKSQNPRMRLAINLVRRVVGKLKRGESQFVVDERELEQTVVAVLWCAPRSTTVDQICARIVTVTSGAIVDKLRPLVEEYVGARDAADEDRDIDAGELMTHDEIVELLVKNDKDQARDCGSNIELVLEHDEEFCGRVRFNSLTKAIEITDGAFADYDPEVLHTAVANWIERQYEIYPSASDVGRQLLHVAYSHRFEPVQEYLDGLTWDGTPRIDTWLETYCHAEIVDPKVGWVVSELQWYVRTVGARWLISAVARAMEPGSKVDTVLVLEGEQGVRKSAAFKILGGAWFSDTPIQISDKDGKLAAGRFWIIELAELESMRKSETESQRNFLSSATDDYRPPYGHVVKQVPRRGVFGGSVNPLQGEGYLDDEAGNRRWWCVYVCHRKGEPELEIDLDGLRRDRDQLWAEAVHRFRAGERWWLEREEQNRADAITDKRRRGSAMGEVLRDWWLKGRKHSALKLADIAKDALSVQPGDLTPKREQEIAKALRAAGYTTIRQENIRLWVGPAAS